MIKHIDVDGHEQTQEAVKTASWVPVAVQIICPECKQPGYTGEVSDSVSVLWIDVDQAELKPGKTIECDYCGKLFKVPGIITRLVDDPKLC